ncbi:substrate-binding periplasmic protein [Planctobacterium marinum]|uniref:Solute-binding protein family 3/N-terminal domain-containing protein n=1 Tax=Planctobacterium marinum TaxID=1631968 RepID=A0AA48I9U5_9ALTE|nr:hypothetical protein MACH26_41160 [Planctobacterium marinum]
MKQILVFGKPLKSVAMVRILLSKLNLGTLCQIKALRCLLISAMLFAAPLQAENSQDSDSTGADDSVINVRFCIPNADVYPFFMFDDRAITGINPDIIRAAFSQKPLQQARLELIPRPWKRCNKELSSGEIDMVIGSFSKERDDAGVYPNELGYALEDMVVSTADVCFISLPGVQLQKTQAGIHGHAEFLVGIEAGFSQSHGPDISPTWVVMYNHLEKYRLLKMGRVDAIVQVCSMDNFPIDTKAEASGYKDFITLQPPYQSNPAYVIFSQQFAAQQPLLARKILQETQKIDKQKIYARYHSSAVK